MSVSMNRYAGVGADPSVCFTVFLPFIRPPRSTFHQGHLTTHKHPQTHISTDTLKLFSLFIYLWDIHRGWNANACVLCCTINFLPLGVVRPEKKRDSVYKVSIKVCVQCSHNRLFWTSTHGGWWRPSVPACLALLQILFFFRLWCVYQGRASPSAIVSLFVYEWQ